MAELPAEGRLDRPQANRTLADGHWELTDPGRRLDSRMIFTPDHTALYVSVPKTGCTTVKTVLAAGSGIPDPLGRQYRVSGGAIHKLWRGMAEKWSDLSVDTRTKMLMGGSVFRFTSVRDPFERLVSCYLDKVARPRRLTVSAPRLKPPGEVSFLEFLKYVQGQPPMGRDPHCCAMTDLCFAERVSYDLIVRYETFESDLAKVMNRLNITDLRVPRSLPGMTTHARQHMAELLGPRECALIREIYAADFETFGYSQTPP